MLSGLNRRNVNTAQHSALSELAGAMVGMAHTAAAPTHLDGKALFAELESGEWNHSHIPTPLDGNPLRNEGGETFLIVASRNGHVDIVRRLLADSPDVDDNDAEGWSSLLVAAFAGHTEVISMLIDAGATVDQPDLMGWTPLIWAVYKNHLDSVRTLITAGAHVNLIDEEDGLTPLIVASGRGFTDIVRLLLEAEAQVNSLDKFGSTSLIWASRKGHLPVVQLLLNAGAEVDVQGMQSSTALMLGTKGNYADVVDLLLSREANTNATDNNGLSALGIAAREGYASICEALVNSGAFVNQSDRYGNFILASAVRSGNIAIVELLLEKYADVNTRDSEMRTALHLAIDKGFVDIVILLLGRKPNLELKNKDGETPLLRAVKSRHVALCQLLVNAGAKVSATDNNGDNALHLALRARSKRLTQTLLVNPSDSRLLYRPNKIGQTPYSIDQMHPQSILRQILGLMDTKMDGSMGYDIYANVLADMVCEPNLTLPLTMGLYAKWGSGKSILLGKLRESMGSFSRSWKDSLRLMWSWRFLLYLFFVVALLTLPVITVFSVLKNHNVVIAILALGFLVFLVLSFMYAEQKGWISSMETAQKISLFKAKVLLLFNMLTSYGPLVDEDREEDTYSNPVSFLFADYHRLSSIGGEQALAKIVATLFESAENHYGVLPVRLFCAFHNQRPHSTRMRQMCGVPILLIATVLLILAVAGQILLIIWLFSDRGIVSEEGGLLIAAVICFGLFLVISAYPVGLALYYGVTNQPKRRVNDAARMVHRLSFEGLMQKLQSEVELLAALVHSLDAFTSSQTRLVVVVDGLDNCEQEKMMTTLDAIDLLFSSRPQRPFITIIAVDPHIIISAVNHNMHSALTGTEITGHDYIKNIVNMPFYLHNSALNQLQSNLKEKRISMQDWKARFQRQETILGSHLSLNERERGGAASRRQTMVANYGGGGGGGNANDAFLTTDYLSALNPRSVKRIANSVTLTGRLMRAFEVEFSWQSLGQWISLCEQFPARMCWLIDAISTCQNAHMTLADVYEQLEMHIPKKDDLIMIDRNPDTFEGFLMADIGSAEALTVGHVRRFLPCTSNLDPYLRKIIHERREALGNENIFQPAAPPTVTLPPNAKHLFPDESVWDTVDTPLVEMRIEDITNLIKRLDIAQPRLDQLVTKFTQFNLNGLVLSTCTVEELKDALKVNLGDWTMVKMLIDTLKAFGTHVPGAVVTRKRVLAVSLKEEENENESASPLQRSPASPNPTFAIEPPLSRKNTLMNEETDEHRFLMQSLQELDLEADDAQDHSSAANSMRSKTSSVRFEDADGDESKNDMDDDAHSSDSIQSRFGGSKDNLLELIEDEIRDDEEAGNSRLRCTYMSQSFYRKMPRNRVEWRAEEERVLRGELMRRVHGNSIHSLASEGTAASLISNEEHQLTVMKKDETDKKNNTGLSGLFNRSQ